MSLQEDYDTLFKSAEEWKTRAEKAVAAMEVSSFVAAEAIAERDVLAEKILKWSELDAAADQGLASAAVLQAQQVVKLQAECDRAHAENATLVEEAERAHSALTRDDHAHIHEAVATLRPSRAALGSTAEPCTRAYLAAMDVGRHAIKHNMDDKEPWCLSEPACGDCDRCQWQTLTGALRAALKECE